MSIYPEPSNNLKKLPVTSWLYDELMEHPTYISEHIEPGIYDNRVQKILIYRFSEPIGALVIYDYHLNNTLYHYPTNIAVKAKIESALNRIQLQTQLEKEREREKKYNHRPV